jgi:iron complex transport system substrate-binding protein
MIENTGIPVITVLTGKATLEKLPLEFEMMGEVLGKEDEASELVSYWNEKLNMIQERVSLIPEDQKKTVYYMLGHTIHTNGGNWWGQEFITAAGGINVAENETLRDINLEELCNWNPDVIIISSNEGSYIPIEDVKNNPQLVSLKAVEDNELYECPIGTFWWDRPSPETPLGIMWLAKTLYPDKFEDVSIENETRSFYNEFYGYNLTDDEIEHIMNPEVCLSCKN